MTPVKSDDTKPDGFNAVSWITWYIDMIKIGLFK